MTHSKPASCAPPLHLVCVVVLLRGHRCSSVPPPPFLLSLPINAALSSRRSLPPTPLFLHSSCVWLPRCLRFTPLPSLPFLASIPQYHPPPTFSNPPLPPSPFPSLRKRTDMICVSSSVLPPLSLLPCFSPSLPALAASCAAPALAAPPVRCRRRPHVTAAWAHVIKPLLTLCPAATTVSPPRPLCAPLPLVPCSPLARTLSPIRPVSPTGTLDVSRPSAALTSLPAAPLLRSTSALSRRCGFVKTPPLTGRALLCLLPLCRRRATSLRALSSLLQQLA